MAKPPAYWDSVALEWSRAQPHKLWREFSDLLHIRLLAPHLPLETVNRILKTDAFDEVSGGEGPLAILNSRSKMALSMDLSTALLQRAREERDGFQGVGADARHLPFAEGSFDFVFSNSTLDHMDRIEDVAQALAEIQRVIRPGGSLLLTLDNLWNPVVALRNALPLEWLRRLHLVPYAMGATCGPMGLGRILREAGFEVELLSTCMHCPRVPAVAMAHVLDRLGASRLRAPYVRFLMGWESLGRWPTRFFTGYFLTALARKPPDS